LLGVYKLITACYGNEQEYHRYNGDRNGIDNKKENTFNIGEPPSFFIKNPASSEEIESYI